MNRQLKELALQAGYPDYMTYGQDLVLERFAELIIRECTEVGSQWADGLIDTKHYAFVNKKIKEHFSIDTQTE